MSYVKFPFGYLSCTGIPRVNKTLLLLRILRVAYLIGCYPLWLCCVSYFDNRLLTIAICVCSPVCNVQLIYVYKYNICINERK